METDLARGAASCVFTPSRPQTHRMVASGTLLLSNYTPLYIGFIRDIRQGNNTESCTPSTTVSIAHQNTTQLRTNGPGHHSTSERLTKQHNLQRLQQNPRNDLTHRRPHPRRQLANRSMLHMRALRRPALRPHIQRLGLRSVAKAKTRARRPHPRSRTSTRSADKLAQLPHPGRSSRCSKAPPPPSATN
jgi:hypothetical protein